MNRAVKNWLRLFADHSLPLLALMAGELLRWIRTRRRAAYYALLGIVLITALHNLPTLITHNILVK